MFLAFIKMYENNGHTYITFISFYYLDKSFKLHLLLISIFTCIISIIIINNKAKKMHKYYN